ncbi:MAG: hypothetical protein AB7U82_26150 [Blastocatellales bacterium]
MENAKLVELTIDEMAVVNGGINWCVVAGGGIGVLAGAAVTIGTGGTGFALGALITGYAIGRCAS